MELAPQFSGASSVHLCSIPSTGLQSVPRAAMATPKEEEKENVYLFYPNLIGYARVALAAVAAWFMQTNYAAAGWCYMLSVLLDEVDGWAARRFDQCTRFGNMVDMLTDRCTTAVLLAALCSFYPRWMFLFQLSMAIDISCHWIHLHASLLEGTASHKSFLTDSNAVLRVYYTSCPVNALMCYGNEAFYVSLYLLRFTPGPSNLFYATAAVCFPISIAKLAIALLQGYLACQSLVAVDVEERNKPRGWKTS